MTNDFGFQPDPKRAQAFDLRMHHNLASSLDYLRDECRGKIAFDEERLTALIGQLMEGRRFMPGLFADYYDLVEAIVEETDTSAEALFERVAHAALGPPGNAVVSLEESGRAPQYIRLMETDSEIGLLQPSPAVHAEFCARFEAAMTLMDQAMPELSGEVRSLIRQLVTVSGDKSRPMLFDGGSHYKIWGALFLNIERHCTVPALIEVIAHESAHSLLFGHCIEEGLVENDDDELFSSPLRYDPRPMDGIYHATFVSARMHWAMSRLAAWNDAADEVRAYARDAAVRDLENFRSGDEIVRQHGRLTATGKAVMDSARAYIASQADVVTSCEIAA